MESINDEKKFNIDSMNWTLENTVRKCEDYIEKLPLKGMTQLMQTIKKVQRQINPSLKVDGVLLTLADMRTNLARATETSLKENYGKFIKVYQTVIPVAVSGC